MTFSQMVEEIICKVESALLESAAGGEVEVLEQDLITYQYVTGKSNPFEGYELLRVEERDFDKFFVYRKPLLIE